MVTSEITKENYFTAFCPNSNNFPTFRAKVKELFVTHDIKDIKCLINPPK